MHGLSRGGTLIRVESLEGRPLLIRSRTACSDAQFLATDGHGNPIPVVTSVTFDAKMLPFDVTEFGLRRVEDALELAEETAKAHRQRLAHGTVPTEQAERHLCAGTAEALSCQLVSDYVKAAPLVVYCENAECELPALAFNDHIVVTAQWRLNATELGPMGHEVAGKIEDIRMFLETQH